MDFLANPYVLGFLSAVLLGASFLGYAYVVKHGKRKLKYWCVKDNKTCVPFYVWAYDENEARSKVYSYLKETPISILITDPRYYVYANRSTVEEVVGARLL